MFQNLLYQNQFELYKSKSFYFEMFSIKTP